MGGHKLETDKEEDDEESESDQFVKKKAHVISLVIGGVTMLYLLLIQVVVLMDVQLLHFMRVDLVGIVALLSIGLTLWCLWMGFHYYLYFTRKFRRDGSIALPVSSVVLPQAYVFLMLVIFGFLFVRWAHFYDSNKLRDYELNTEPQKATHLVLTEAVFSAFSSITVFLFCSILGLYYSIRRGDVLLIASEKSQLSK